MLLKMLELGFQGLNGLVVGGSPYLRYMERPTLRPARK